MFIQKIAVKFLESKFIKGKLTYLGVAVMLAPLVSYFIGLDVSSDEVGQVLQVVGTLVAIAGRWRALHQATQTPPAP